jgi:hypothetical protein
LTADHLEARDVVETAKGNKGTVFWKPAHGEFVRYPQAKHPKHRGRAAGFEPLRHPKQANPVSSRLGR